MNVPRPNPIHTDPSIQHVDVRIYFAQDEDPVTLRDDISEALQASPRLAHMISAYELVNDGFAHLTPTDKPLA